MLIAGIDESVWKCKQKLRVTQQLTSISDLHRQHLPCTAMVMDPISDTCIMKILCRRGKFNNTEYRYRSEWYHPFCIGIGTDVVFRIPVPDSTAGSTEIPKYQKYFIRYFQLC